MLVDLGLEIRKHIPEAFVKCVTKSATMKKT
jgi:hypothetical protein